MLRKIIPNLKKAISKKIIEHSDYEKDLINDEREINLENYSSKLSIGKIGFSKVLFIDYLEKVNKESTTELKTIVEKLINTAKKENCQFIVTCTWIFSQHPEFAKKLGFVGVKSEIENFNKFLQKNDVNKIIALEQINLSNNSFKLKILDKNNKIRLIYGKIKLPKYILDLKD